MLHSVAGTILFFLYPFANKGKDRIRENLKYAIPALKGAELNAFIKENLHHSLRVTLEIMQARKFKRTKFINKYVIPANDQTIPDLLAMDRKPVVIGGHLGSWEIPMPFLTDKGIKVTVAAKRQSNPYVNRLIEKRRHNYGGDIVFIDQSEKIIRDLRKKYLIGLVADQDAGGGGTFVDFFHRKASAHAGPALLAYLAETKLMIMDCIFQGRGRYVMNIIEIDPCVKRNNFSDRQTAVKQLTQAWNTALEKEIMRNPVQYFWLHRRWKSQPV